LEFTFISDEWPKKLKALLPNDRPFLDSVIDSGGGEIVSQTMKLLRPGGTLEYLAIIPLLENNRYINLCRYRYLLWHDIRFICIISNACSAQKHRI
jgi:NADPH:quinone reductase-like Zn-dependent oxidoreductase